MSLSAVAAGFALAAVVFIPLGGAARPAPAQSSLFAVVNVDGTLDHGNGVVSSAQLGADGTYEVIFNRDVTSCAYVGSGAFDDALTIGVAPRDTNPNGVYVVEYDTVLGFDSWSSGFDLIVMC